MTMSPALEKLLAALPEADQLNLFAFWDAIYQARYTGAVHVDVLGGVVKQIGLGNPIKLSIVEGAPPRLDSRQQT